MVNIFRTAWAAAASFYHIKMGSLRPSRVAGVDVVVYDYKVSLYDTLGYAMEKQLPVLQTYSAVLYDQIELVEEIVEGELTERFSFRQVEVVRSGNWWSEWQPCSVCVEAVSETAISETLPYEANYTFSIEDGPLSWETVSPLLDISDEKDSRFSGQLTFPLMLDQQVAQAWCQAVFFWFDARYQNCTLKNKQHLECSEPSELFHGDAPYGSSLQLFQVDLSYRRVNCQC